MMNWEKIMYQTENTIKYHHKCKQKVKVDNRLQSSRIFAVG